MALSSMRSVKRLLMKFHFDFDSLVAVVQTASEQILRTFTLKHRHHHAPKLVNISGDDHYVIYLTASKKT